MMMSSSESSIPKRLAIWMLVTFSFLCCSDVMPKIPLRHWLGKDPSFLVKSLVVALVWPAATVPTSARGGGGAS